MAASKVFLIRLLSLTVIISILLVAWNYFTPAPWQIHYVFIIPIYFFSITLLLHSQLLKAAEKDAKNFVYSFMGSTALRMFITLIALIIFIFIDRANAMNFAVAFLFSYFVYLIFEVVELQRFFKK